MCVIAAIPAGCLIPSYHLLKLAWDRNPDGAGFMYPDGNGGLTIVKGLMSWNAFKTAFSAHRKHMSTHTDKGPKATVDVCVHFRIRSHGPINAEMTHPFLIPHQGHLAIAHNGILRGLRDSDTVSDTVVYIMDVLAKLPIGWQRNRPIRGLIERDIGPGNKFVIMDETGIRGILNRASGVTDAQTNVWWSNDYHIAGRPAKKQLSIFQCAPDEYIEHSYHPDGSPDVFTEPRAVMVHSVARAHDVPIITEARYEPDTGEMVVSIYSRETATVATQRLSMTEVLGLRQKILDGKMVSECSLNGHPSFAEILAAMKLHHDETK